MKIKTMQSLKKLLLLMGGLVVVALVLGECLQNFEILQEQKELKSGNFPEVFKENTLIVVDNNASKVELRVANDIAKYLEEKTGNKPLIKESSKLNKIDKKDYNLIIISTQKSNKMFHEICKTINLSESKDIPLEKGMCILRILKNPWNVNNTILLIRSNDEIGLKLCRNVLISENFKGYLSKKGSESVISLEEFGITLPIDSEKEAVEYVKLIDNYLQETIQNWKKLKYTVNIEVKFLNVTNLCQNCWLVKFSHSGSPVEEKATVYVYLSPNGKIVRRLVIRG